MTNVAAPYDELCMQEYLLDGNVNTKISQLIFKARSMTLDIKMQKKWKYSDTTYIGCGRNNETGQEILSCDRYVDGKDEIQKMPYCTVYFILEDQVKCFNWLKC